MTSRVASCVTNTILLLFSHWVLSDSLQPHGLQHARPPSPSLSTGVCSSSHPPNLILSWKSASIFFWRIVDAFLVQIHGFGEAVSSIGWGSHTTSFPNGDLLNQRWEKLDQSETFSSFFFFNEKVMCSFLCGPLRMLLSYLYAVL